jgi:hypothetical protein
MEARAGHPHLRWPTDDSYTPEVSLKVPRSTKYSKQPKNSTAIVVTKKEMSSGMKDTSSAPESSCA